MKKIINKPTDYVKEMLEGIYLAHANQLEYVNDDVHCLVTKNMKAKKVALVTGGGSGHLPLFLGYVGDGLLDGCAVGDVFQSPSPKQIFEISKHLNTGAGVLYIYGNYNGDIMNFEMASDMLEAEGIETLHVVGNDDVISGIKGNEDKRRGVAGIFFIYKCASSKADQMASLQEVYDLAQKVANNVRTVGVALTACIVPEIGTPSFDIGEDEIEIGMGIHGEPGIERTKMMSSDEIVSQMVEKIMVDLPYGKGDEVAVLINGLGGTSQEELYIMYKRVHEMLTEAGVTIFHSYLGEFATSMEMKGASISFLKLDAELKELLRKSASTPFFCQREF